MRPFNTREEIIFNLKQPNFWIVPLTIAASVGARFVIEAFTERDIAYLIIGVAVAATLSALWIIFGSLLCPSRWFIEKDADTEIDTVSPRIDAFVARAKARLSEQARWPFRLNRKEDIIHNIRALAGRRGLVLLAVSVAVALMQAPTQLGALLLPTALCLIVIGWLYALLFPPPSAAKDGVRPDGG